MKQLRAGLVYRAILVLTILVIASSATFAQEREGKGPFRRNTGIGFWTESLSRSNDIGGGTYVSAGFQAFLGNAALLDMRYLTDLMPLSFNDHLALVSIGFKAIDYGEANPDIFGDDLGITPPQSSRGPVFVIAPTYVAELAEIPTVRHYVGLTITPFHTWKALFLDEGPRFAVELLSIRLLLDLQDYEFVWGFSTTNLAIF